MGLTYTLLLQTHPGVQVTLLLMDGSWGEKGYQRQLQAVSAIATVKAWVITVQTMVVDTGAERKALT